MFDLVLFGATGFTGKLIAEYFASHAPGVRWAIAGRNREKLEAVKKDLGGADVPVLIADSNDAGSLRAIAKNTKVVCTTVGPYSRYGTPLVEQCVEAGIGYCDLTGEVHWAREMIDRFHARAEQTGARIVHCAGFDSLPSDLGVLMVADYAEKKFGRKLGRVRQRVTKLRGGFSGGTVASLLEILRAAKSREVRRVLGDPYGLVPRDAPRGHDKNEKFGPQKDSDRGKWTAPFLMASVNTRVVRRSNALMHGRYGSEFSYEERMDTGSGPRGYVRAAALTAAIGLFAAGAWNPVLGSFIRGRLPKPGEGPPREKREKGSFRFEFFAELAGEPKQKLIGIVAGKGDPGYAATSMMLGEAALCLALDQLPNRGGILTPATAMGVVLIERLRRAGMTFSCEDVA